MVFLFVCFFFLIKILVIKLFVVYGHVIVLRTSPGSDPNLIWVKLESDELVIDSGSHVTRVIDWL